MGLCCRCVVCKVSTGALCCACAYECVKHNNNKRKYIQYAQKHQQNRSRHAKKELSVRAFCTQTLCAPTRWCVAGVDVSHSAVSKCCVLYAENCAIRQKWCVCVLSSTVLQCQGRHSMCYCVCECVWLMGALYRATQNIQHSSRTIARTSHPLSLILRCVRVLCLLISERVHAILYVYTYMYIHSHYI